MISKEKPNNHPIHVVHTNLEYFIFYNDNNSVDLEIQIEEV